MMNGIVFVLLAVQSVQVSTTVKVLHRQAVFTQNGTHNSQVAGDSPILQTVGVADCGAISLESGCNLFAVSDLGEKYVACVVCNHKDSLPSGNWTLYSTPNVEAFTTPKGEKSLYRGLCQVQ